MQIRHRPTGEYATIDTTAQVAALRALRGPSPAATVEDVLSASQRYAPPVLYALASVVFARFDRAEGAFWYYAAQLRTRFDVTRCADPTVGSAVAVLRETYGEPINRYAFADRDTLRATVDRAVAWDRATPHDYDHRWINLHGMGAFGTRPGEPLSVPAEQWADIAEQVRVDYRNGLDEVLRTL